MPGGSRPLPAVTFKEGEAVMSHRRTHRFRHQALITPGRDWGFPAVQLTSLTHGPRRVG